MRHATLPQTSTARRRSGLESVARARRRLPVGALARLRLHRPAARRGIQHHLAVVECLGPGGAGYRPEPLKASQAFPIPSVCGFAIERIGVAGLPGTCRLLRRDRPGRRARVFFLRRSCSGALERPALEGRALRGLTALRIRGLELTRLHSGRRLLVLPWNRVSEVRPAVLIHPAIDLVGVDQGKCAEQNCQESGHPHICCARRRGGRAGKARPRRRRRRGRRARPGRHGSRHRQGSRAAPASRRPWRRPRS